MKHVFGIASNLAFYEAHHIIELDHLPKNDCIFLLLRNYTVPNPYTRQYPHQIITSYNTKSGEGRVFAGWRLLQTQKNIQEFDQLVNTYIQDEPFIWYTQVCSNDICSLMVTKPNCKGYYILEDGTGSYRTINPKTFTGFKYLLFQWVLKPLWPRIFTVKEHYIETNHPKFLGCIATSQNCFPLHQSALRVIGNPFVPEYLPTPPDAILSMDALFFYFDQKQTEEIIALLAQEINKKGYQNIYYKHHPYVLAPMNHTIYEQYETLIHQYFSTPLTQLPATACLENILTAYHCDFYTVLSSVALYAHIAGCSCFSPLHRVKNHIPTSLALLIEEICQPI